MNTDTEISKETKTIATSFLNTGTLGQISKQQNDRSDFEDDEDDYFNDHKSDGTINSMIQLKSGHLAVLYDNKKIVLWDVVNGSKIRCFDGKGSISSIVEFSNSRFAFVSSNDTHYGV